MDLKLDKQLVLNVFTKRVHKLKQFTNLILHDKNYTPFVSLLVHKMRGGEGGAYSREGGAYFKFRPIGGTLIRRRRLFEGALTRGFTVFNEFLTLRSIYQMVLKVAEHSF